MKYLFLLISCTLLLSCNSGDKTTVSKESTTSEASGNAASGNNIITFKVGGEPVTSSGWQIAFFKFSNMKEPGLNITSDMHQEKRTINVNLAGTTAGTYTLTSGNIMTGESGGVYFSDYGDNSKSYQFISGTFTLTEVNMVKKVVNGTFSGEVKNPGNGEILPITDGRIINGTLKADLAIPAGL